VSLLDETFFENKPNLKYLNLKHTMLKPSLLGSHVFLGEMDYIGADDWRFCCFATRVRHCDAVLDKLSSCADLLSKDLFKVCIWAPALFSFVSNGMVLIYRGKMYRKMSLSSILLWQIS